MSTLNLYNVQKARFWDELLAKERLQSQKAVNAIKTIRTHSATTRPTNDVGELLPGRTLTRAKRRDSDAKKPPFLRKAPIVRMEPTIPNVTGKQYQALKNSFRPQTAPQVGRQQDDEQKFGLDPRFSSQVGYHLFGFSDIQKTFPIKDKAKATEYETSGDYLDAMTVHDRKAFNPVDVYKRPVTASQDIGWNAFDQEYYKNRRVNRSLIHPLKSSEMTKFAAAMTLCGRNR